MKKLMFVTLGIAALAVGGQPVAAQAQVADAIQAVNDSATAKLQDGLSKAQSGGVGADAMRQLKLAVEYGKARLHKEARLSAQGALRHLCVANQDQGPGCDTVPKFGSYTAP